MAYAFVAFPPLKQGDQATQMAIKQEVSAYATCYTLAIPQLKVQLS